MEDDKGTEEEAKEDATSGMIADLWYKHGLFCATHPKLIIILSSIVIITCSTPLFLSPGFNSPATEEGRTTSTFPGNESTIPHWFDGKPLMYVVQFVLTTHLTPWMTTFQSNEVMREALIPAFHVTKAIIDFRDNQSGKGMSDVCLNVTSGQLIRQRSGLRLQDSQFLPAQGCLLLSPSNLWNRDIERFSRDNEVFDNLYQEYGRPAFNIALKEFIFGASLKQTGLYPKMQGRGPNLDVKYAITLIMTSHHQSYIAGLKRQLLKMYPVLEVPVNKEGNDSHKNDDQVFHIYYKGKGGSLVELGPISVAYFVVFLYLAFSVAKIDMVKSKWGLAFSAVITVMASLTMAGGVSTFFGFVPTLDSSEVFPYLVIMVGVENILVITKSVVSTPVDLDVKIRVAQGLSKEGKYMLKNIGTEMFVVGLGYFTFVPAIQEFCLFAFIGLLTDFFLQVFLFATILSIDIRRMEISDLHMISIQQAQIRQNNQKTTTPARTSHPLTSTAPLSPLTATTTTPHLLPPLPPDSVKSPSQCPVIPSKSKRLKLAYFLARTRMVQRACMVCAVLYFMYMVFYSVTPSTFHNLTTNKPPELNKNQDITLSKLIQQIISENVNDEQEHFHDEADRLKKRKENFWDGSQLGKTWSGNVERSSYTARSWQGLSKQHWPQLLSYYNISLLGRYISILPPVHLGFNMDVKSLELRGVRIGEPKPDSTHTSKALPVQSIQDPASNVMPLDPQDPEYYLNALYCVVLGVLVMIILFFVCKYLNDLQIRPKTSGTMRRSPGVKQEELVEAVPLSLRGHPQTVEHFKCTASSIVSICLSGQIRVWDRNTGESLNVINRSGEIPLQRRIRRKKSGYDKKSLSHEPDKEFTTSRYFQSIENESPYANTLSTSPDVFSDSDGVTAHINTSDENRCLISRNKEDISKKRSESIESCPSDNSGYDFGPCYQQGGSSRVRSWSPRWSSSRSLNSSWSSDEEYPDHLFSCSEESPLEQHDSINTAGVRDEGLHRTAAVWCLDCRGDLLATGCSDGCVELWSLSSGRQICLYCENRHGVTSVAFVPDSHQIVVARIDGTLDFLNLLSPAIPVIINASPVKRSSPRTTRKNQGHVSTPLNPTTSGTSITTPVSEHTLPVMCSLTHRVRAHHQPVSVMVVTKGRVVTGSRDRTLKVFRTDECVCIFTLHGHRDGITALKIMESDPRLVISGAANGGVRVWDVSTGECLQHLRGHTCSVIAIACTQCNIVSVSIDNSMCIWDRQKGKCIHYKLRQFPDLCSNVSIMSNNLFVTGGQGCIAVWDLLAGRQVKSIPLDNGDASVLVRHVTVCDTASVVCDYGKELRVITFPSVMNKAE